MCMQNYFIYVINFKLLSHTPTTKHTFEHIADEYNLINCAQHYNKCSFSHQFKLFRVCGTVGVSLGGWQSAPRECHLRPIPARPRDAVSMQYRDADARAFARVDDLCEGDLCRGTR